MSSGHQFLFAMLVVFFLTDLAGAIRREGFRAAFDLMGAILWLFLLIHFFTPFP